MRFVQCKGLAHRTQDSYLCWIRQLNRFHPDQNPPKLVSDQVLDFLIHQQVKRKLEGSTLNQAVCSLRNFYRDHLGLDWDIWKKIKIKRTKLLPNVLTREEVALLLSSIRENRFRALFTVIYQCGLRLSEATHIAPKHINGKRLVIRIKGKGGKWREVPITAELYSKLRRFWSAHRNPKWLFPGTSGHWKKRNIPLAQAMRQCSKPMSHASIYATLKVVLAETGLLRTHPKITPHTLRHSYATHLLDAGASVRQVSAYLGHSSLKDTMVYLHLTEISEEKAREALKTLPGL